MKASSHPQAAISIKTDPELKELAMRTAKELGVSLNAVMNRELKRFALQRTVTFDDFDEVPNEATARLMEQSRKDYEAGDYYKFDSVEESLAFLKKQMR